jgi:hypothetical protein
MQHIHPTPGACPPACLYKTIRPPNSPCLSPLPTTRAPQRCKHLEDHLSLVRALRSDKLGPAAFERLAHLPRATLQELVRRNGVK